MGISKGKEHEIYISIPCDCNSKSDIDLGWNPELLEPENQDVQKFYNIIFGRSAPLF